MISFCSTNININPEPFNLQEKANIIGQSVNKMILALLKASNNQFFSYENILFETKEKKVTQVSVNEISFVGMTFFHQDEEISMENFA